jgi:hypothetical protein
VDDGAEPVSYRGVQPGTPLLSSTGQEFGTLDKVLEVPEEDLFDGVIVKTSAGRRFVDRDQIEEITTRHIRCNLDDDAVAELPAPSGTPIYHARAGATSGVKGWFSKRFGRGRWDQDS